MLAYAADDTRHLPRLRDAMRERLIALNRLPWAEEEFRHLEDLRWTGSANDGQAYQRVKGAKALAPRSLAALRELVAWREGVAAERDTALFRVIGNESLVAVSRTLPRSVNDLGSIRELPTSLARRNGPALVAAVGRALATPEHDLPTRERAPRAPHDPELDGRVERLKTVRNAVAAELGLDPGVLCGKATLEAVARQRPGDRDALVRLNELRNWQVDVLGTKLLAALQP
jgi:ribonuclease D